MNLRRRSAKVEQTLAELEKGKRLANCICGGMAVVIPGQPQEFEAKMNQNCPAHGIFRFARIMRVAFVGTASTPESEKERIRKEKAEVEELVERYYARVAAEADSPSSDL